MRCAEASPSTCSICSTGPDTVTLRQLLIAATSTSGAAAVFRNRRASRSSSISAAMPPRPRTASWCRLRAITTSIACSRLSAPAHHAAAISPTLCPSVACGARPCASRLRTVATCRASSSGCACVACRSLGARSSAKIRSTSDAFCRFRKCLSISCSASRNRALECQAVRPMPAHCAPLPENTNATGRSWPSAWPLSTPGADSPTANSSSCWRNAAGLVARTRARWGSGSRRCAAVAMKSPTSRLSDGQASA